MKLLQEAATQVKSLDRNELLKEAEKERDLKDNYNVFLITTYNPNYHQLKEVVFSNWEMLGKTPATDFLYQRRLMCGHRKPKNLIAHLIRANIPHKGYMGCCLCIFGGGVLSHIADSYVSQWV